MLTSAECRSTDKNSVPYSSPPSTPARDPAPPPLPLRVSLPRIDQISPKSEHDLGTIQIFRVPKANASIDWSHPYQEWSFEYLEVKLLDYNDRWAELEADPSPAA